MKNPYPHLVRTALVGVVAIAGVVTILGSGSMGSAPPPKTGSVSLSVGFGAVAATPYRCTGSGVVTLTPQALTGTDGRNTQQSQTLVFDTWSSTTPNEPACQQTAIFGDLRPGTWAAASGATTCTVVVTAGQFPTVRVWNGACR